MRHRDLFEALATDAMKTRTYYHGTKLDANGRSILEHGINPGNLGIHSRGQLQPLPGRSYLTTRLDYGVIYCIGGNMLGCSEDSVTYLIDKAGSIGWLFVIHGANLVNDIQPDEDSVGEAAMFADMILTNKNQQYHQHDPLFQGLLRADPQWLRYFHHNAKSSMTKRQWGDAVFGLVAAQAAGGKRFLKVMNDADKINLINAGAHVAYKGNLQPDQAWRFDKTKACQLEKDGSNFFQLAEQVR